MFRQSARTAKTVTWNETSAEVCTPDCRAEARRDRARTQALSLPHLPR